MSDEDREAAEVLEQDIKDAEDRHHRLTEAIKAWMVAHPDASLKDTVMQLIGEGFELPATVSDEPCTPETLAEVEAELGPNESIIDVEHETRHVTPEMKIPKDVYVTGQYPPKPAIIESFHIDLYPDMEEAEDEETVARLALKPGQTGTFTAKTFTRGANTFTAIGFKGEGSTQWLTLLTPGKLEARNRALKPLRNEAIQAVLKASAPPEGAEAVDAGGFKAGQQQRYYREFWLSGKEIKGRWVLARVPRQKGQRRVGRSANIWMLRQSGDKLKYEGVEP